MEIILDMNEEKSTEYSFHSEGKTGVEKIAKNFRATEEIVMWWEREN